MAPKPPRVAVVGTGAWGTTLALLVSRREPVTLLGHSPETVERIAGTRRNEPRLPEVVLPATIQVTVDPAHLEAAELVVFAVPSRHLRATTARIAAFVRPDADLLSVVKGLEPGSLDRMSEVVAQAVGTPERRVAALSGPNLALEIARGLPASAVVAAEDEDLARRIQVRLGRRRFRLYTNPDIRGVELCGALKNIVAIAAGAADGLGFGDNGKAGLITRGLAEMIRLGIPYGAHPLTFAGLAGIGDLIATCGSRLSRNHRLGEELARGRPWSELETALPGVAEGAYAVDAALELARRHGVEMPIAQEVHLALYEGKSAQKCLHDLLSREQRDELAGFPGWDSDVDPSGPGRAGEG